MIVPVRISARSRDVWDVDFEELYLTLAPVLRTYAERLGLPPEEAEAVVHDAFAGFLGAQRPIDNARKWLFGATRNAAISHWRKMQRTTPPDPRFHESTSDAPIAAYEILRALPYPERKVLWMKEAAGYKVREIARHFRRSVSWTEKTLRRAREAAREAADETNHRRGGRGVRAADTYGCRRMISPHVRPVRGPSVPRAPAGAAVFPLHRVPAGEIRRQFSRARGMVPPSRRAA